MFIWLDSILNIETKNGQIEVEKSKTYIGGLKLVLQGKESGRLSFGKKTKRKVENFGYSNRCLVVRMFEKKRGSFQISKIGVCIELENLNRLN